MSDPMPAERTTLEDARKTLPGLAAVLAFIGPVSAIGGVQLMATMDGPVAVFALPRIQNELGLSDAGRSWVITAYMLTFGGLILLGGRLGDVIGRKRTFIGGVALFTVASVLCGIAWNGGALVAGPAVARRSGRHRRTDLFRTGSDHVPEGAAT